MKNNILLEHCLKTFNSKEFKEELKNFIKPVAECIFKELYIYLFFLFFLY